MSTRLDGPSKPAEPSVVPPRSRWRSPVAITAIVVVLLAVVVIAWTRTRLSDLPASSGPVSQQPPAVPGAGDGGPVAADGFVDMGSGRGPAADADGQDPVNEKGWEQSAVAGVTGLPSAAPVTCPPGGATVRSPKQLAEALAAAGPGTVITLADGIYPGRFLAKAAGRADAPIFLCGGAGAVLDGGGVDKDYVLHLDGAAYWRVVGLTIRNGQKGVMADTMSNSILQGLTVTQIGDEGIHLRRNSVSNVVRDSTISETGKSSKKYGEGIYVGSAKSNWCSLTSCRPDRSDHNVVTGNRITNTTSENVDIKEGTTGGLLSDNQLDGSGSSSADSWVDLKGNAWLVQGNRGTHAPKDGFQTHQVVDGWGDRNRFSGNVSQVDAAGFAINLTPVLSNIVDCANTQTGAGSGLANVTCQ
jgi:hypothetical protein